MRWNNSGSSADGFAAYFSASLSIASCTKSRASCSSRTANTACLKARRSTSARKVASSFSVARRGGPVVPCAQDARQADVNKSIWGRWNRRAQFLGAECNSLLLCGLWNRVADPSTMRTGSFHAEGAVDLTHHFLIAMPSMVDTNFAKSLTYICEHNEQGALGVVVNRPID